MNPDAGATHPPDDDDAAGRGAQVAPPTIPRLAYTVEEIADAARLTVRFIEDRVLAGGVAHIRGPRRKVLFTPEQTRAFLDSLTETSPVSTGRAPAIPSGKSAGSRRGLDADAGAA